MRIVYVSSNLGVHDYRFLSKLAVSEHEVFLITHYPEPDLPLSIARLGDRIKIINYDNPLAFGAGADSYPVTTRKMICWSAFLRSYFRFRKDIKAIKPDLIHAGWVQTDGFLAAVSGFHPFLLMPWGSDILLNPKNSRRLLVKTRYVIKQADLITCDCLSVKEAIVELAGYPAEKIAIFPWGVDQSIFKPNAGGAAIREKLGWQKNKILLMIRSFEVIYGVEYFIRALPRVIKERPDVRVILGGDGSLKSKLAGLVDELGVNKYVHFAGFIKNEELPPYFSAADIYVSSSLSDGSSLSLLEALACGLPVVVSNVSSYYEWVNDNENGFIVSRSDSIQLADKIIHLLNDESKCLEFGRRNLQIARDRADWDKNYRKLETIYSLLVKD